MTYQNLELAKEQIVKKAQRRLANNFPDYEYDKDTLGDYFDDAVRILMEWKKYKNYDSFVSGAHDGRIVNFIVQSINITGIEGQSYSSANGITKTFIATPEDNLKASIPQTPSIGG